MAKFQTEIKNDGRDPARDRADRGCAVRRDHAWVYTEIGGGAQCEARRTESRSQPSRPRQHATDP